MSCGEPSSTFEHLVAASGIAYHQVSAIIEGVEGYELNGTRDIDFPHRGASSKCGHIDLCDAVRKRNRSQSGIVLESPRTN